MTSGMFLGCTCQVAPIKVALPKDTTTAHWQALVGGLNYNPRIWSVGLLQRHLKTPRGCLRAVARLQPPMFRVQGMVI